MHFVLGDGVFILEELLHQVFVVFRHSLDQLGTEFLDLCFHLRGDIDLLKGGAHVFLAPDDGAVLHQVHNTFEISLVPDREHDRHRIRFQHVTHLLAYSQEVGSLPVHLVHKAHARDLIIVRQAPVRLGLGLHAVNGAEQEDKTVEYPQGAVHLNGEIHVPGGVDDIEVIGFGFVGRLAVFQREFPGTGGRRGGNRNPAFLLLLHPVHGGSAVMDFSDLVAYACIKKDAFGSRSLSGVDVRRNTDVPCIF